MIKLTLEKKCQGCGKTHCRTLYYDKERGEWYCNKCTSYLKKTDNSTPSPKMRSRGQNTPRNGIVV